MGLRSRIKSLSGVTPQLSRTVESASLSAISDRPIFNGGLSKNIARPPSSMYFLIESTSGC